MIILLQNYLQISHYAICTWTMGYVAGACLTAGRFFLHPPPDVSEFLICNEVILLV